MREIKITKPQTMDFKGGVRLFGAMFILANKHKDKTWSQICETMRTKSTRIYKACLKTIYAFRKNTAVTTKQIGDAYINSILQDKLKSKKFLTNLCKRGYAHKWTNKDKQLRHAGITSLFDKHFNKRKKTSK